MLFIFTYFSFRSGSVEPRERRRSRLAEDPSPVRERKTNQESGGGSTLPPPSPVKETRSARLLAREEVSGLF